MGLIMQLCTWNTRLLSLINKEQKIKKINVTNEPSNYFKKKNEPSN